MIGVLWAGADQPGLAGVTRGMSAHLLPVYDKPAVFYPMSLLLLAGLRELVLVAGAEDLTELRSTFGDGSELGVDIGYAPVDPRRDVAQVFDIVDGPVAVADADSFLYGQGLGALLREWRRSLDGAVHFRFQGRDAGFSFHGRRARGDDIDVGAVVELSGLPGRYVHHRTSSYAGLLSASRAVQLEWRRDAVRVGCVEEAAWRMGCIDDEQLCRLGAKLAGSDYGAYVTELLATSRA